MVKNITDRHTSNIIRQTLEEFNIDDDQLTDRHGHLLSPSILFNLFALHADKQSHGYAQTKLNLIS